MLVPGAVTRHLDVCTAQESLLRCTRLAQEALLLVSLSKRSLATQYLGDE